MHLQRLTVENFRAFRDTTIDFPATGLVMLAGPNSVGKSSLLSALDVVAGLETPNSIRHMAGGQLRIRARFALTEADRALIAPRGETPPVGLAARIASGIDDWVEWTFSSGRAGPVRAIQVASSANNGELKASIIELNRAGKVDAFLRVARQGAGPLDEILAQAPAGSDVTYLVRPPFLGPLSGLAELLLHWRRSYFHFPAARGGAPRSQPFELAHDLEHSGQNLAAVLHDLQTNRSRAWERLQALVATVLPEVGTLRTSVDDTGLAVTFEDAEFPEHRHNLRDLGTGVEQVLLAALVGEAQPQAGFVAIEEPETALHPAAQRAMLGMFRRWSQDRLFVLTTHSPIFLDSGNDQNLTYLVRRSAGASTITRADPGLADVLAALGVRTSDVLSAERILLVEGPSDRDVLAAWWPELIEDPRNAVIVGQGGSNARFAGMLDEWIRMADRLDRTVLYLRDHDELPDEELRKLRAQKAVHVLERREIENYLLDPAALTTFFAGRGVEADPAEVATAVREAADEQKPKVIIKSVAACLPVMRLVDNQSRGRLARNVGSVDEMVTAVMANVLDREQIEARIRAEWERVRADIEARWEADWRLLAPGEEVLRAVFLRFLKEGYGKTSAAGELARCLAEPPAELRKVITRFLGDVGRGDRPAS
ncbi:AAA family ATPase [Actinoplanes sp. L3-i22]|uniref:AAA family ATPase n=1 Tax=Actinoplanes sp. L3-i22 TaxID=2836373 RepID=UPI001C77A13E|nr:AAA family ATPase [Actinoplanes sp. L3-i22]BCY07687.1 hypothetical protein L3i22_027750 [Actinoplanes sp. L3-i22]